MYFTCYRYISAFATVERCCASLSLRIFAHYFFRYRFLAVYYYESLQNVLIPFRPYSLKTTASCISLYTFCILLCHTYRSTAQSDHISVHSYLSEEPTGNDHSARYRTLDSTDSNNSGVNPKSSNRLS
jgi:hypothetical protein